MDLGECKIYLCLTALCCGPTQEDADFLRSLGTLLRVPQTEQASCITMLTAVSQATNPFEMAEELALKLRQNIDRNTALEKFCMLFLLCFHPPDASTVAKNRQTEKLYQHVQFNAKTSVIFRRLALLLRIKLSTVTKLEAMAIEHWKILQYAAASENNEDDEAAITATTPTSASARNSTSSKRNRRKHIVRGLKIGATAAGAGVLLGVTGGLAAPALAAGLAHIGLGAAATFTTTASVAAILGTGGAGLAGYKMNRRLKVVKTFEFHAINEQKKQEQDETERDTTGMTVYVCVSGYLRSPGPVVPKLMAQKQKEETGGDQTAEGEGKQRRGMFGQKRADDTTDKGDKKRRGLFRGRGRDQDSSVQSSSSNSNNQKPRKSILRAKSTAVTSPEFYEPWGAQPPVMFPQHVLDRYYAVVAPEKRFLVPMLLQKYRQKYKKERRRLKKQSESGGDSGDDEDDLHTDYLPKPTGGDLNWTNSSDDELEADIDYGLTPDDQAFVDSLNAPDEDGKLTFDDKTETAEEKLFALLEREYGVHPLQIMEAAEASRKEQQKLEGNSMDLYRSLLLRAQLRMESLLTIGHSSDDKKPDGAQEQDLVNDPIQHQDLAEMMNLQRPWDKVYTIEDQPQNDTDATSVSTLSTYNSNGDDDVLIKLDENHTDEEQVSKIIDDLNNIFGEIDDSTSPSAKPSTPAASDQSNEELLQEMQKLEIDTGSERKGRHDIIRRKLFEKKAKSLKAKADQATDIYWWRESVARTGEQYTLVWEPKILLDCGRCVENLVKESASKGALSALQLTALAPIILTITLPVVILSVVTLLDNYWSVATSAADEAGELLADALLSGAHGNRPVVLVGYSVGGRVVASCLRSLARVADSREDRLADDDDDDGPEPETGGVSGNQPSPRKERGGLREFVKNTKERKLRAKTIVRDAVIIGAPLDCNPRRWTRRRSVVQGRLINVYNPKDWVLALLYRYKSWSVVKLAGLKPVQCNPVDGLPSIENYNVSDIVGGHNEYHARIRDILDRVGMGDVNSEKTHSHYFSTGVVEILKDDSRTPKKA